MSIDVRKNVVDLSRFRDNSRQELIDDVSAKAFLLLRQSAEEHNLPIKDVLMDHLLGIGVVIQAVEGKEEALRCLHTIANQIELS